MLRELKKIMWAPSCCYKYLLEHQRVEYTPKTREAQLRKLYAWVKGTEVRVCYEID